MILGIGTDIIEIKRIQEAMNKNKRFLERVFTPKEIQFLKDRNLVGETVAGSFAVKEAVSKALGTGIRGFSFDDIEVLRNPLGKPEVVLSEKIYKELNLKDIKIHASISHNRDSAIAFVLIEEE